MKELIHPSDPYHMNWVEGNIEWGTTKHPESIRVEYTSEKSEDCITEHYTFTNISDFDVFTYLRDLAIYTPFNDNYTSADICVKQRCHTHLLCGENISYVMALRMGGEGPHLGLVLTEGSIGGYSVERDLNLSSNDRGDFLLHPSPTSLLPGESSTISWVLFWHNGKEDFYEKARKYNPHFIDVQAENFTLFDGEKIKLKIRPAFSFGQKDVHITSDFGALPFEICNGEVLICTQPEQIGEIHIQINISGVKTHCNLLILPKYEDLLYKRCEFIVRNQQYHNSRSVLDGAYLPYDNEEKHIYYSRINDYNGGRERIGMGVLIARYLQHHDNSDFEASLQQYIRYMENYIFDTETGKVYDDANHSNHFNRMYNYPWVCLFNLELFQLYRNQKYLLYAYRVMISYYQQNGAKFYAILIPLAKLYLALKAEGLEQEAQCILEYAKIHSENIIQNGLNYPAHEVKFEQSIAQPATDVLLQTYRITKEPRYLDAARLQLHALELFSGLQPDYHLYEVAIRHWDGYWFGKRKMFGDTFPHYWSSLSGKAYSEFAGLTGNDDYQSKAEASLRGTLSMFNADGSASCACVYPASVNGSDTGFYDPLANDQDWGMYFMQCFLDGDFLH